MNIWNKFLLFMEIIILTMNISAVNVHAEENDSLRILYTSDLHDNILPHKSGEKGENFQMLGGYAYLKDAVDKYSTDNSLLLDVGDFSMGSVFNSIFISKSPDYSLLGDIGYDAVALGNHEFDYGVGALSNSLINSQNKTPIVIPNIEYETTYDAGYLSEVLDSLGNKTMVIEKNGVKIGIFALMGEEAANDITNADGINFIDRVEYSKKCVDELNERNVDVIICLSHSGINKDEKKSEDIQLAEKVDGIDIILSGHSHTLLEEPLIRNNTIIASCGVYGEYLGVLDYDVKSHSLIKYENVKIDNKFDKNVLIDLKIDEYKTAVQDEFLDKHSLEFDEIIARSNKNFDNYIEDYGEYRNRDIGDLVADALVYECRQKTGISAIGVTAMGVIRANIYEGDITASDVYNICSLGMGDDKEIGYPLVIGYVNGEELRSICEIDVSVTPMSSSVQLFFSGLRYTYSENRMFLNHVIEAEVLNENGEWEVVEDNKLYPVVMNRYLGEMLPNVAEMTYNWVKIRPKNADGSLIQDFSDVALKNLDGSEVKEWIGLIDYFRTFDKDLDGVPIVPEIYNEARETKIQEKLTASNCFKNTSYAGKVFYSAIFAGVVLITGLVVIVIKRAVKKK